MSYDEMRGQRDEMCSRWLPSAGYLAPRGPRPLGRPFFNSPEMLRPERTGYAMPRERERLGQKPQPNQLRREALCC